MTYRRDLATISPCACHDGLRPISLRPPFASRAAGPALSRQASASSLASAATPATLRRHSSAGHGLLAGGAAGGGGAGAGAGGGGSSGSPGVGLSRQHTFSVRRASAHAASPSELRRQPGGDASPNPGCARAPPLQLNPRRFKPREHACITRGSLQPPPRRCPRPFDRRLLRQQHRGGGGGGGLAWQSPAQRAAASHDPSFGRRTSLDASAALAAAVEWRAWPVQKDEAGMPALSTRQAPVMARLTPLTLMPPRPSQRI